VLFVMVGIFAILATIKLVNLRGRSKHLVSLHFPQLKAMIPQGTSMSVVQSLIGPPHRYRRLHDASKATRDAFESDLWEYDILSNSGDSEVRFSIHFVNQKVSSMMAESR
jgi:hypothetical protein